MLHLWIIFQLVIDQSFKLIEKLHKIKKRFLKVVGVVSPLLLPRREAKKEIIEADTDPMKEVLCLGAAFAPTQQIILSNLVQGGKP